jgi:hypothetical protein
MLPHGLHAWIPETISDFCRCAISSIVSLRRRFVPASDLNPVPSPEQGASMRTASHLLVKIDHRFSPGIFVTTVL